MLYSAFQIYIFFQNVPTLWIGGIIAAIGSVGNSRTSPAPQKQLALAEFLEFTVIPVLLHLADPYVRQPVLKYIANLTVLYSAASIYITCRQNCQMSVTSSIDHALFRFFRNFESSRLFFFAGRTIPGKCEHLCLILYHRVNNIRHFINISAGNCCHNDAAYSRPVDSANLLKSYIKASRFTEPVMSLPHSVQGKLVFFTSIFF